MVNARKIFTGILIIFLFVFAVQLVNRQSSPLFGEQFPAAPGQPIRPANANNIRLAGQFATGSSTGGIQEAIDDVAGNGEVWVTSNVTATAAIKMKASVNVRGIGDNVAVTFTGATNGFVWPGRTSVSRADYARLYSLAVVAGNPSSAKAIDIEDPSSAAADVVVEDVRITSNNAPTNVWAYGIFLSNALLERFSRVRLQSATIHIHTDGFSNSDDFENVDLTSNVASAAYVDFQGGSPITFIGGEIEGNARSELVSITQAGPAATYVHFIGTSFENANTSGIGVHVNGGRFEATNCQFATAKQKAFVVGDISTTNGARVIGGEGAAWTLGANAIRATIMGYFYSGAQPLDLSTAGSNTVFDNFHSGDNSYAASSFGETPDFSNGIFVPFGKKVQLGNSAYYLYVPSSSGPMWLCGNGYCNVNIDSLGRLNVRDGVTPTTYDAGGTPQRNAHIVGDRCTLGRNCSVTLSGSAAFTGATTYHCTATDGTAANAVHVNQSSGSTVVFTGTGTDVINFTCMGY